LQRKKPRYLTGTHRVNFTLVSYIMTIIIFNNLLILIYYCCSCKVNRL